MCRSRRVMTTETLPGCRFASADALIARLDTVRNGIAHDLHQCALNRIEYLRVEPDVAAATAEGHQFRLRAGGVEYRALERREKVCCRNQSQPLCRFAQLAQFAIHLVDDRDERPVRRADFTPQFAGEEQRLIGVWSAITVTLTGRDLRHQKVGKLTDLLHTSQRRA